MLPNVGSLLPRDNEPDRKWKAIQKALESGERTDNLVKIIEADASGKARVRSATVRAAVAITFLLFVLGALADYLDHLKVI